jgi:hypothetical protein
MQQFEFIDNRKAFRGAGIVLLALLLLATWVIISAAVGAPDVGRPDIRLPKIGALPAANPQKVPMPLNAERATAP